MTAPRKHLTQHMIVRIHELLKPRLRKIANSDLWEYEQGWSDARISEMLRPEVIGSNHIAQVRSRLFGNIHPTKTPSHAKVEKLAAQNAAIMASLIRIESKVDHLLKEIGAAPWTSRALNGVSGLEKALDQED